MENSLTPKEMVVMDRLTGSAPIDWIVQNIDLTPSDSVEAIYDAMESQSGKQLPVIYQPFDGRKRGHFADRGQILDFATILQGGRILDFGPGDGWPSLGLAPMVDEVVGVDASARRVAVCFRNCRRLGLNNVQFVRVPTGGALPFPDHTFDGVSAASSVEQTPDPRTTLRELHRVLKRGGRLRIHYESLGYYRGWKEREARLEPMGSRTILMIYDRDVAAECVRHYQLLLDLTFEEAIDMVTGSRYASTYAALTPRVLQRLCEHLDISRTWTTQHPSCPTMCQWLTESGFEAIRPTYDGGWFSARLFDRIQDFHRPKELDLVDGLLRPVVSVVVNMIAPPSRAPREWDPWITAVAGKKLSSVNRSGMQPETL